MKVENSTLLPSLNTRWWLNQQMAEIWFPAVKGDEDKHWRRKTETVINNKTHFAMIHFRSVQIHYGKSIISSTKLFLPQYLKTINCLYDKIWLSL